MTQCGIIRSFTFLFQAPSRQTLLNVENLWRLTPNLALYIYPCKLDVHNINNIKPDSLNGSYTCTIVAAVNHNRNLRRRMQPHMIQHTFHGCNDALFFFLVSWHGETKVKKRNILYLSQIQIFISIFFGRRHWLDINPRIVLIVGGSPHWKAPLHPHPETEARTFLLWGDSAKHFADVLPHILSKAYWSVFFFLDLYE